MSGKGLSSLFGEVLFYHRIRRTDDMTDRPPCVNVGLAVGEMAYHNA